jgi:hypothetical protein
MLTSSETEPQSRLRLGAICFLYLCAAFQFIRFYAVNTTLYLDLPLYLAGKERIPFQERVLPIVLMKPIYQFFLHHSGQHQRAFSPERAPLFLVSLGSFLIACFFTQMLYRRVSRRRDLLLMVFPVFLFTMIWSYALHVEANYSYPYDMPSVAFFSAGLYFVASRRFYPLLAVMLIGSLNRETTLFLIGIYLLEYATPASVDGQEEGGMRLSLAHLPWLRAALLFVVWLAIKLMVAHRFAHNPSEDTVRVGENFFRILTPALWPGLLQICGYMVPVIVLLSRQIRAPRFRRYLWILPFWFVAMLAKGVLDETRIYGEFCPFAAVALVLIVEEHVAGRRERTAGCRERDNAAV